MNREAWGNRADFATSLALIAFGLFVAIESWDMPRFEDQGAEPWSAPGLVPGLLGLVFIGLGTILLLRSLRRGGHRLGVTRDALRGWIAHPVTRRLGLTLGLCLIYGAVLLGRLPYALATGLFAAAFVLIFECTPSPARRLLFRRLIVAGIEGAAVAAVVTLVFETLFLVKLP